MLCLVVNSTAREDAFKTERRTMQKFLSYHAKNAADFRRLGEEQSTQIRDLKASMIGLEVELQLKNKALKEMERRLADAEARLKGE